MYGNAVPKGDNVPMESLEILKIRLKNIEKRIEETKQQLPAHSIKPPVMIRLLDLEDERDDIMARIDAFKKNGRADWYPDPIFLWQPVQSIEHLNILQYDQFSI